MEHIKDIINRIKYKFSYPYRLRCGYGLSAIRNPKELEAIVEFCRKELEDKEMMDMNPERKRVYEMTVLLADQDKSEYPKEYAKLHDFEEVPRMKKYNDPEEFINEHVGWYWN